MNSLVGGVVSVVLVELAHAVWVSEDSTQTMTISDWSVKQLLNATRYLIGWLVIYLHQIG
jgi:hypothetical protein